MMERERMKMAERKGEEMKRGRENGERTEKGM